MASDWFRAPGWSTSDREEFEVRLKRTRATSRAQYLRIKAFAIEAEFPEAAEELLRRLVTDYSENWPEVAFSHERLGDLRRAARYQQSAESHYRSALDASPPLSGTTGEVHIKLAELLFDRDGRTEEVYALLDASRSQLTLNQSVFRWLVLRTRATEASGDHAGASAAAQNALDLLHAPPQFSRHPTVGLARASPELIDELRETASGRAQLRPRRFQLRGR